MKKTPLDICTSVHACSDTCCHKVIPLLLEYGDFISSSSISIIMLMQITLIMCQEEIQGMGLVFTYITKH